MYRLVTPLCIAFAVLALAATSSAQPTTFFAEIRNDAENPPAVPTTSTGDPRPASFGTASFVLNEAMTELSFTAEIFNIDVTGSQTPDANDNLTNAHIHAGASVTPTTNGGVVWGFHGSPFNNNNPNDAVFTPFTTGVGGIFSGTWNMSEGNNTTLTAQLPNILEGRSYINFHTVQFGGGEIRGNIAVIPEPATGVIAACCAGLAFVFLRRLK